MFRWAWVWVMAVVSLPGVVAGGWVTGGVEGVAVGRGVVAWVVAGIVVVAGSVVTTGVGGGGFVVPVETVVAPMEKLMRPESGACISNEAGSCHFAWTV